MLKGVIFDLDGVITDTSGFHYLCWKRLADEYSVPFDKEFNERFKGVSRLDCARMLFPDIKDEEEIERLANKKNDYYVEMCQQIVPEDIFPGVIEFLSELRKNNIKTAIGSVSKNTDLVLSRLQVKELFDAIVGGRDIKRSKPAPDVFLLGAEKLGLDPKDCIVIEDAYAGIEAAHAAGMLAVGIGTKENLPIADMVVPSVKDLSLKDLIELYNSKAK